jgi:IclR family transcriptional regulator, acetate operon repressor
MNMKIQPSQPAITPTAPQTRRAQGRGDTVQSLIRALSLLNALAKSDHGMTLGELAQESGLPVSTAHRLLSTLQHENFVRHESDRGVWLIGVQAFIVGNAFIRSRDLTAVARPFMRTLMERSGETVNLAVEDRGEIVYIAQTESRQTMRTITRPGGRVPMHCSALGKMLLALMPETERERIMSAKKLVKETEKTITSLNVLRRELEATAKRCYAIDDEENALGMRCVAAPIYDEHSAAVGAVSLSGPSVRIAQTHLAKLGAAVKDTADQITARLGGIKPR